ncbi:MAG: hypothetical protein H6619_01955 [Deltaproteobacteria bacterium]|nr:hypothetical protein [Deltaproteobacteria bacterium]
MIISLVVKSECICMFPGPEPEPREDVVDESIDSGVVYPDCSDSVFQLTEAQFAQRELVRIAYLRECGKDPSAERFLRDATVPDHGIRLDPRRIEDRVIIALMDQPLIQRTRSIRQLGTAHLVFMDGNHVRFAHGVGSGALAAQAIEIIASRANRMAEAEIRKYSPAVVAVSISHDVGHVATGSHLGESMWFPNEKKAHEKIGRRFVGEDLGFQNCLRTLDSKNPHLLDHVLAIMDEDSSLPPWTWKMVSGGGWNIDREDWTLRDSVHCGVNYGRHDRSILLNNLVVTDEGDLAIRERGLEVMEQFFEARKHLYNSVYYHEVCRVAFEMFVKLAERARELYAAKKLETADPRMQSVLSATTSEDLSVPCLLGMTESWFGYHLEAWTQSRDPILSDYATKLLTRKPFKHFDDTPENRERLTAIVSAAGLDPNYYLLEVEPVEHKHDKDLSSALRVLARDGKVGNLEDYSQVMHAFQGMQGVALGALLAVPEEVFVRGVSFQN